jgi:hypothetical protein
MSMVRIVNGHGQAVTVDVEGADTTHAAAEALAGFMRPEVYFTGEHHPHNDSVRTLLEDRKAAALAELEEAQAKLWAFTVDTAGE